MRSARALRHAESLIGPTVRTPAFGQRASEEMTPDEKAMMEAYMMAGTPGEQHKMLASQAGEYTTVARSWGTRPPLRWRKRGAPRAP